MSPLRAHPHLLEINTAFFLDRLSAQSSKPLTLGAIPEGQWKTLADQGFDMLWAMGMWKRSPGSKKCALADPSLRSAYDKLLPGWSEEDVPGSPYAIFDYAPDPGFGTPEELAKFKTSLNAAGLKLILDYVPNHMAFDHPWTRSKPACFVEVPAHEFQKSPDLFFKAGEGTYLAHGRDPYFPAWRDTVQVNFFSEDARKAAADILLKIAETADGIRCDMAMLAINRIFEKNWAYFLGGTQRPEKEFWIELIGRVRERHPDFIFLAEAYWDLEWELQQMGFDFTYDKKLYDRLLGAPAAEICGHLKADAAYQSRSARFIENHDEARAVTAFGKEKSMAAAGAIATLPGMRFFYDGQMEGKKIQTPIQLGKEPREKEDREVRNFYQKVLDFANARPLHLGAWRLLEAIPSWQGSEGHKNFLCWAWEYKNEGRLIAVNYSAVKSQCRIGWPAEWAKSASLLLKDALSGVNYERDCGELCRLGLFVELEPWKAHLFEFRI